MVDLGIGTSNSGYITELQRCVEAIQGSDEFADILSASPLKLHEGASLAPFDKDPFNQFVSEYLS